MSNDLKEKTQCSIQGIQGKVLKLHYKISCSYSVHVVWRESRSKWIFL